MPAIHTRFPALLFLALAGLLGVRLTAQQINLSLEPTAVPDSFEVRATATSGVFTALANGTFTLRWELSSGGVANNSDIRRPYPAAFPVYNSGGTQDIGAYRYFTLNLFGDRTMEMSGCTIDTNGIVLCGVRIRELVGCRHIALVQNAFTGMNNLDFYFSVGGYDVTGVITSAPIAEGDCSGCVPPAIQSIHVDSLPMCGSGPVHFSVVATGTNLDYSWTSPTGAWIGYDSQGYLATGTPGAYVVSVSNGCGTSSDTATAFVSFNPDLCEPAVLDSAWFEYLSSDVAQMHASGTGSCLSYRWILPDGSSVDMDVPWGPPFSVAPGTYTVVLFSACGNDTLALDFTPVTPCFPPWISMVTSGGPVQQCNLNPFALYVHESLGSPEPVFEWTAPDGSIVASGDSAWLDPPQDGLYMVRAINACGVDSAFYPVQLDTAGLAACIPPVILGMSADTVCFGDTALVQVDVDANGPCITYQWGEGSIWNEPVLEFPIIIYNNSTTVSFTLSNACGSVSENYTLPVVPLHTSNLVFCGLDVPLNLDSLYAGYLVNNGYWTRNGEVVPGIYQSVPDSFAQFYYWDTECLKLSVGIMDGGNHNAGNDASIQICSDSDPVDLFPLLGVGAEPGGHWYYESFGVIDGHYDPDWFSGTPTTVFRYIVGLPDCMDTAFVTVTETPGPFPWYADADGDGLGNPLDSLLSCDSIPGYVTVAGDACPDVPGTIGSPCDDGLAWTVNDTLDANCLCMGIPTAVLEQDATQWRLWPNPAKDHVYLQAPHLGPVSITVLDARGRVVLAMQRNLAGEPVGWPTAQLARGAYAVRILSPHAVRVLRLVVE